MKSTAPLRAKDGSTKRVRNSLGIEKSLHSRIQDYGQYACETMFAGTGELADTVALMRNRLMFIVSPRG
jgi:hypothetical protein